MRSQRAWALAAAAAVLALWLPTPAGALGPTAIQCPGTTHFYEFIFSPGITWTEALAAAQAQDHQGERGHLATLTSPQETDCLVDRILPVPEPGGRRGAWIGAMQESGAEEPAGGWSWITGEPMDYTDWCDGEPNGGTVENYMEVFVDEPDPGIGCWNDAKDDTGDVLGFVVEYPRRARMNAIGIGAAYEVGDLGHPGHGMLRLPLDDLPLLEDGSAARFDVCLEYEAEGVAPANRGRARLTVLRQKTNGRIRRAARLGAPIRDGRAYVCKTRGIPLEVGDLLVFEFDFVRLDSADAISYTAFLYPAGEAPAAPD